MKIENYFHWLYPLIIGIVFTCHFEWTHTHTYTQWGRICCLNDKDSVLSIHSNQFSNSIDILNVIESKWGILLALNQEQVYWVPPISPIHYRSKESRWFSGIFSVALQMIAIVVVVFFLRWAVLSVWYWGHNDDAVFFFISLPQCIERNWRIKLCRLN